MGYFEVLVRYGLRRIDEVEMEMQDKKEIETLASGVCLSQNHTLFPDAGKQMGKKLKFDSSSGLCHACPVKIATAIGIRDGDTADHFVSKVLQEARHENNFQRVLSFLNNDSRNAINFLRVPSALIHGKDEKKYEVIGGKKILEELGKVSLVPLVYIPKPLEALVKCNFIQASFLAMTSRLEKTERKRICDDYLISEYKSHCRPEKSDKLVEYIAAVFNLSIKTVHNEILKK